MIDKENTTKMLIFLAKSVKDDTKVQLRAETQLSQIVPQVVLFDLLI